MCVCAWVDAEECFTALDRLGLVPLVPRPGFRRSCSECEDFVVCSSGGDRYYWLSDGGEVVRRGAAQVIGFFVLQCTLIERRDRMDGGEEKTRKADVSANRPPDNTAGEIAITHKYGSMWNGFPNHRRD